MVFPEKSWNGSVDNGGREEEERKESKTGCVQSLSVKYIYSHFSFNLYLYTHTHYGYLLHVFFVLKQTPLKFQKHLTIVFNLTQT